MENLDEIVQQKLDADIDFTASLEGLSDEDKTTEINKKKSEIVNSEFKSLNEQKKEADKKFLDQQARAKKLEDDSKKTKPATDELTVKDGMILATAGVHADDIDEVVKASKLLGKSIAEALKDNVVKNILNEKAEIRKSAEVANSKPRQQGNQKPNNDAVMKDAMENDKIPEKGSAAADQLFRARRGIKD